MREVRYTQSDFELRGLPGDEGARLEGYAAVFMQPTIIGGTFREQVGQRAFAKTIEESDIRALWNHDSNHVLGRNRAKTLGLSVDEHGLKYDVLLPNTQMARDLWTSIDRGDISQSSFSFETVKQELKRADPENALLPLRTLLEVKLFDVSPCTYPAYETTEVEARSILDGMVVDLSAIGLTDEPESEPGEPHSASTPQPWQIRGRMVLLPYL